MEDSIEKKEQKSNNSQVKSISLNYKDLLNKFSEYNSKEKTKAQKKEYVYTSLGKVLKKGDEIGMFNLGSTIIILFEAGAKGKFKFQVGDKIKYGMEIFG